MILLFKRISVLHCKLIYSQLLLIRHPQNSKYVVQINRGAELRIHFSTGSQWSVSSEIVRIKHSAELTAVDYCFLSVQSNSNQIYLARKLSPSLL